MELAFEDEAGFGRAALSAAVGAGAAAATAAALGLWWGGAPALIAAALAAAAGGGAVAASAARRGPQLLCALAAVACGVLAVLAAGAGREAALAAATWLSLQGALVVAGMGLARRRRALAAAERAPSQAAWTLALLLGAAAGLVSAQLLPALHAALAALATALLPLRPLPASMLAAACAGVAAALWLSCAGAAFHLAQAGSPVEARLRELRAALSPELRALAERVAAAHAALRARGESDAGPSLRGPLEALALGGLSLAARAAELSRSASPALEEELARRAAALHAAAAAAVDGPARESYQRAAAAQDAQRDHCLRARRTRERIVARLHEEAAQLERARFALELLQGDPAAETAELDLLGARLLQLDAAADGLEPLSAQTAPAASPVRG